MGLSRSWWGPFIRFHECIATLSNGSHLNNSGTFAFITHEYSHRIIEQIAGLNSQINFKWFNEGLAECEGRELGEAVASRHRRSQSNSRIILVVNAYVSGALIPFKDVANEKKQWDAQIERGGQLAYTQAWAGEDHLISQRGIAVVLHLVGKGQSFTPP